ncbi:hypothetical protein M514_23178, partial [Trichuris suis]
HKTGLSRELKINYENTEARYKTPRLPKQIVFSVEQCLFAGVFNLSSEWAKKVTAHEIPEVSVPAVIVVQPSSIAMNVRWLFSTVQDEKSAPTLVREKCLLHQERLCPSCSELMQLGRGGKAWACYNRFCTEEVSIRTQTWFEGIKIKM